jgi:glycosyltransferase AglE
MKKNSEVCLPTVSVIIPVHNDYGRLILCLNALNSQDYPKEKTEIIVVDNLSDHVPDYIRNYNAIFLREEAIKSSYAARNKGILNSKGSVVAFLDSDCIPYANWLSEGVNCMIMENADLVGGDIIFDLKRNSFFHKFDSRFHLQQEFNINNNTAITANLFVNKFLFEKLELFPEWNSGGDSFWTGKAVGEGYKLLYAKTAIVKHPSRGLFDLLKKRKRIGIGLVQRLKAEGKSNLQIFKRLLLLSIVYPGKSIPKGFPKLNGFLNYLFSHFIICNTAFGGMFFLCFCKRRK